MVLNKTLSSFAFGKRHLSFKGKAKIEKAGGKIPSAYVII